MVDFTKNKTWAATQVIEDDADAGGIGKLLPTVVESVSNLSDSIDRCAFLGANNTLDQPVPTAAGIALNISRDTDAAFQLFAQTSDVLSNLYTRSINLAVQGVPAWAKQLSDKNIGGASFDQTRTVDGTIRELVMGIVTSTAIAQFAAESTAAISLVSFTNTNGIVGSISTSGTSTAYNVSSDPRLKDFKGPPVDETIDIEFNKLFGCFDTFNWKNDPEGQLVWGFNAHACIDAGLDIGTEGQGSRELSLGDVYNTIPAVIEPRDVQVLYKTGDKKGQPRFNADGSPMMETVDVEVTPEIKERVSPAGVDQAKAVPILLAKIEQLERRLLAAGL